MKTIIRCLIVILAFACSQDAVARRSNSQSKTDIIATTREAVDSLKSKTENLNADSISGTVVIRTRPDKNTSMASYEDENEDDSFDMSDLGTGIKEALAVIFVLAIFLFLPAIVIIVCVLIIVNSRSRRKRQRYELIRHCVDMGQPLPREFYLSELPKSRNYLRSGIVWIGWGLASILFCFISPGKSGIFAAIGVAVIFVGVSRLALYWDEHRRESKHSDPSGIFIEECENTNRDNNETPSL